MRGLRIKRVAGLSRTNKYGSKSFTNEFGKWDSKLEYHRYLFLLDALNAGVISNLERQVSHELIPTQWGYRDKQLKTKVKSEKYCMEKSVSYVSDFEYDLIVASEDGQTMTTTHIVEDTKCSATRKKKEYVIKRKLMLYVHDIRVKEITRATEEIQ